MQRALTFILSVMKAEVGSGPNDFLSQQSTRDVSVPALSGTVSPPEGRLAEGQVNETSYESVARQLEAAEKMDQLVIEDELASALASGGTVAMATKGTVTQQELTDLDRGIQKDDGLGSKVTTSDIPGQRYVQMCETVNLKSLSSFTCD